METEVSKVHAEPTKGFFIQMLTKDILLESAILDLLDNSVDGAKKIRGEGSFENLYIDIFISGNNLVIKDNCGGFSLKDAIEYAFMFGRPSDAENEVKNSVGRFGVGMKRALFKMGKKFEVESKNGEDHFQVDVDVDDWSSRPKDWTFDYKLIDDQICNLVSEGTYINVSNLYEDVSDEFNSPTFLSSLKEEIENKLNFSLNKGITVRLNDQQLIKKELFLLENNSLKPYNEELNLDGVNIKIFAGIGRPDPSSAGWYIYCNDRLVLANDKTPITGWEGRRLGIDVGTKYHNIFAMFRGVVFFTADDSKKLPMTTTKIGVDSDSIVYKAAKSHMVKSMTQVFAYLRKLESVEERADIVTSSQEIDVITLKDSVYEKRFIYPTVPAEVEDIVTVSFRADKHTVSKVKSFFSVSTNKECGIKLLEYFLKYEEENL